MESAQDGEMRSDHLSWCRPLKFSTHASAHSLYLEDDYIDEGVFQI